jgi:Caspase domain
MRTLTLLLCAVALLCLAFLARAEGPPPEPRTALIIGNAAYSFTPLRNPINDAEAMAKALEVAGFKIIMETDADQAKMVEAFHQFGAELKRRGGVGLFYFSGHGTQIDGESYLLPVGEQFASLEDVKRHSVMALAVVDAMASAHGDLNIIILDACRNSPIDPSGAKGLAGVYRVKGTNPNGTNYRGKVTLTQDKDRFNFTWWIGKDVFRGSGQFACKMLVVNWGNKTPVIYTFGDDGALDGEWADSSATETLDLVANAAPGDIDLSEGSSYKGEGKNADGTDYEGTVEIEKQARAIT